MLNSHYREAQLLYYKKEKVIRNASGEERSFRDEESKTILLEK